MATLDLIGALLILALVDSINPSALLVTGYILAKPSSKNKTASVIAYVIGIFVAYVLAGVALLFGLQALVAAFGSAAESRPAYILQGALGLAMFIWSWLPPKSKDKESRLIPRVFTTRAMLLLGTVVTLTEFVTAFPYFAAVGLLQQSEWSLVSKLGTLLAYNIVFILPPLALLALYRFNQPRFEAWLQKRQERQKGKPSDTMQWIVGALGVILLLNAVGVLMGGN